MRIVHRMHDVHSECSPLYVYEVNMENVTSTTGQSGDLFGKMPFTRNAPLAKRRLPPELTAARVLCRQLRRQQSPRDKQRIAHLICLNLLSMLRRARNEEDCRS